MEIVLSVLTLNVWGIPYISRDREIRINAIAEELAKGSYDIVSLQEVWSESDYQFIKNKTENTFPYTHYFYSGVFGSGLCLLSKYPIVSTLYHAWSVNGYVHRIQHADWFGGKGVGLCRILVNNKPINIYIAHLHAEYDNENDEYKAHRVIQAFDTAQFIESTRTDAVLQVLAGDLNTEPDDLAYKVLVTSAKLFDCCDDHKNTGTNECKKNSYTSSKAAETNPVGKRIDHILIRPGDNYHVSTIKYRLPFDDRIPGQDFSYSDHEAVSVRLHIIEKIQNNKNLSYKKNEHDTKSIMINNETGDTCDADKDSVKCNDEKNIDTDVEDYEVIAALQECISVCDSNLQKLRTDRVIYFSMAIFFTFLLIAMMDFLPPYGMRTIYLLTKFLLSGIIIFMLFMATLWNLMERHGILSGKLSMEIALKNYEK